MSAYSQWVRNTDSPPVFRRSTRRGRWLTREGGRCNTVNASYSSILCGGCNTVCAVYSSILGGSGNSVAAAYPYSGIFGQNVAAQASNTFHVECLNAINTPCYTGTAFPPGTIFACCPGSGLPFGALPLYIA